MNCITCQKETHSNDNYYCKSCSAVMEKTKQVPKPDDFSEKSLEFICHVKADRSYMNCDWWFKGKGPSDITIGEATGLLSFSNFVEYKGYLVQIAHADSLNVNIYFYKRRK